MNIRIKILISGPKVFQGDKSFSKDKPKPVSSVLSSSSYTQQMYDVIKRKKSK